MVLTLSAKQHRLSLCQWLQIITLCVRYGPSCRITRSLILGPSDLANRYVRELWDLKINTILPIPWIVNETVFILFDSLVAPSFLPMVGKCLNFKRLSEKLRDSAWPMLEVYIVCQLVRTCMLV